MQKFSLLFFLSIILNFQSLAQKKVLLIGVDGCRPDALRHAHTPGFDLLMSQGIYTLDAKTDELTFSGPGWTSMLTGVNSAKHGVDDNRFSKVKESSYSHFFSYLPESMKLVSIAHWFPINRHLARPFADKSLFRFDPGVANRCRMFLDGKKSPDVIFLHFDGPDHAGHQSGYGLNSPKYIAAIEQIDEYVLEILADLEDRKKRFPEEEWLVIASTDHGGRDYGHRGGKDDPARRNIFIIVNDERTSAVQIQGGNVMDVAATILDFLEIKIPSDKQLDGVSLLNY